MDEQDVTNKDTFTQKKHNVDPDKGLFDSGTDSKEDKKREGKRR